MGVDGADYLARLKSLGISAEFMREVPGMMTAQALIMTDTGNNQITAFHPGAMTQAHINTVTARDDIRLGIVSPDGREAMQQHARQFKAAGIPFVFDPGQMLLAFDGAKLLQFIELALYFWPGFQEFLFFLFRSCVATCCGPGSWTGALV